MPSVKHVNDFLKLRDELVKHDPYGVYVPQKKFLDILFRKELPKNIKLKEVQTKAYILDSLYFTRSGTKYLDKFAENIIQMKYFDQRLKERDLDLVNEIAFVEINEQDHKTIYSFATKYCSFHYPEKFPIYDSNVRRALMYFKKQKLFYKFIGEDLKDYPKFYEVMSKFKNFYGLEKFTWIDLDRYLFLMGRKLKNN